MNGGRRALRIVGTLLLSLGLGLGALWIALPDVFRAGSRAPWLELSGGFLTLAFVLMLSWWGLGGLRTVYLLRLSAHDLTLGRGVMTYLMGLVASVITPSAGGNVVGVVWILTRFGVPLRSGLTMSVYMLIFDMAFFSWATLVAALYLARTPAVLPAENLSLYIFSLAPLLVALCLLLTFRLGLLASWLRPLAGWPLLRRFAGRLNRFIDSLELAGRNLASAPWTTHLGLHSLSAALWLSRFALLAAVVAAFRLPAPPALVIALNTVLHATAFAVPTPGASGYQELALAWLLDKPGQKEALASAIVLWRLLTYYLYFLIGPLLAGLLLAHRTSAEPQKP